MNPTPAAGNGDTFDPQEAAALLDDTSQRTRRQLQPTPPWALATRAVMVLAAMGAIWLSVRGQHPYRGPTAVDIPVLVVFIVVNFVLTVTVRERALAGVTGKTRFRPREIAIAALSWIATAVLMGTLISAGVRFGHYPTTVLIIPGLTWAGLMAARAEWRNCVTGLEVFVIGIVGLFAGAAGSWLVGGVGLCLMMLGQAAEIAWRQRA